MDILQTARLYIREMVHLAGPQMKVLLMDKETTSIVSCAYAQSEMMQKEVYLFERIDAASSREPIKHLKCIVFLRPTADNIHLLSEELRNPRYAQYYIYFSNIIGKAEVKQLAEADEHETVREMHEFFVDGIALSAHLFSLPLRKPYEGSMQLQASAFRRASDALIGLLLALKKKPLIRYQKSSQDAQKIAQQVCQVIRREETLFEDTHSDTVLLVLDRFEDPVTPLLNQWTYEAMVHELLSISQNCVIVEGQKFVLSEQHDDFYANNISANFGEIGVNIKALMNEFQQRANTHKNLESIADMKNFVDEYPQFKKISGTVSKHVTIVGELSRLVSTRNLLEVSELEQTIVSEGDHSRCVEQLKQLLANPKTTQLDALRLVMLYALRFENHSSNELRLLLQKTRSQDMATSVEMLLRYAGMNRRRNDLFGLGSAMEITKRFIKGLKGVENIYTQHEPPIGQLIEQLARGRLPDGTFPTANPEMAATTRPDNVIVFIVGGTTYAESAVVRTWNEKRKTNQGLPSVLLASTHVHNTTSFIEQLNAMK